MLMRRLLLVPWLLAPAAQAQELLGGYAVDARRNSPLACLDVVLLDSAGTVLRSTVSGPDGGFQLFAPAGIPLTLRFEAWGAHPVDASVAPIVAGTEDVRRYRLDFIPAFDTVGNKIDAVRTLRRFPPMPAVDVARPGWPTDMRQIGQDGNVVLRVLVDTTGRIRREGIEVLGTTHPSFTASAVAFHLRERYRVIPYEGVKRCEVIFQWHRFRLRR